MGGTDQEATDGTSQGETGQSGWTIPRTYRQPWRLVVTTEKLLENHNVDGVGSVGVRADHGSDQDVLLDGEGTRVERALVAEDVELANGQDAGDDHTPGRGGEATRALVFERGVWPAPLCVLGSQWNQPLRLPPTPAGQ